MKMQIASKDINNTSIWLSVDPMASKYPSLSPYVYCANNPIKLVDPDGMEIDEWEINKKGQVKWVAESDKHQLFALGSDGQRTGECITVGDRAILDDLSINNRSDYNGSYGITGNIKDAFSVFKFGADNTDVEWRVDGYRTGSANNKYFVGTSHDKKYVQRSSTTGRYNKFDLIFMMHSHPGETGTKGASGYFQDGKSYCGDMSNITRMLITYQEAGMKNTKTWFKADGRNTVFPKHYVYHPASKTLYNYTPWKFNNFIRNIGKSSDLHRNLGF